jgi:hypothetical protein
MQQEVALFQEPPEDESTINHAAFYTQNQSWVMGEVEEYIQKVKAERKAQEEEEEEMSDDGEDSLEENED